MPNCLGDRSSRNPGQESIGFHPNPVGPTFSDGQFILGRQASFVGSRMTCSGVKTKLCSWPGAWPLPFYPSAWGTPASAPASPTSHRHQQQDSSVFLPQDPAWGCPGGAGALSECDWFPFPWVGLLVLLPPPQSPASLTPPSEIRAQAEQRLHFTSQHPVGRTRNKCRGANQSRESPVTSGEGKLGSRNLVHWCLREGIDYMNLHLRILYSQTREQGQGREKHYLHGSLSSGSVSGKGRVADEASRAEVLCLESSSS